MKATGVVVGGAALAALAFAFMNVTGLSPTRTDGTVEIKVSWLKGPTEVSWSVNQQKHHKAYAERGIGDWFYETVKVKPGDVVHVDGKLTGRQAPNTPDYEIACEITSKGVKHTHEGDGSCTMTLTIVDV